MRIVTHLRRIVTNVVKLSRANQWRLPVCESNAATSPFATTSPGSKEGVTTPIRERIREHISEQVRIRSVLQCRCHYRAGAITEAPFNSYQNIATTLSRSSHPHQRSFWIAALVAAMASLSSAFLSHPCPLPIPRLAPSPSPSTPFPSPRRLSISCSQAPSDVAMPSCSRREVLGMGGMLALAFHSLATPVEADAGQATCGKYNVTTSGLGYCDSDVGTGIAAAKGMLIKAHYSGRLENGSEFDSSYKRGKPLTFRVGVGEVIRGWDQGILGTEGIPAMQAGGKRTLKIPAQLGYGERGAGCRLGSCLIPPNSVLIFDVEFVGKA